MRVKGQGADLTANYWTKEGALFDICHPQPVREAFHARLGDVGEAAGALDVVFGGADADLCPALGVGLHVLEPQRGEL